MARTSSKAWGRLAGFKYQAHHYGLVTLGKGLKLDPVSPL